MRLCGCLQLNIGWLVVQQLIIPGDLDTEVFVSGEVRASIGPDINLLTNFAPTHRVIVLILAIDATLAAIPLISTVDVPRVLEARRLHLGARRHFSLLRGQ